MSSGCFDIVFYGETIDGFERDEVKNRFATLFSLKEVTVEKIFAANELTLKSSLNEAAAKKYQTVLANIGTRVEIQHRSSSSDVVEATEAEVVVAVSSPSDENTTYSDANSDVNTNRLHFVFNGSGGEYYKIWVVNLLLTLVSLGIYSAWTKVKNKRYFYENTQLQGVSFEYLANPVNILSSRVVVAACLVSLIWAMNVSYIAVALLSVGLLALLPWWVVRSLKFNAYHSAYRNTRFSFRGSVLEAAKVFLAWPVMAVLSLGALAPVMFCKQQKFLLENHYYGHSAFQCKARPADYFIVSAVVTGIGLLGGSMTFFLFEMAAPLGLLAALIIYVVIASCFMAMSTTSKFNTASLEGYHFSANCSVQSYIFLFVLNTLAIIFTLGQYTPYARVRVARYLCANIDIIVFDDANHIIFDD